MSGLLKSLKWMRDVCVGSIIGLHYARHKTEEMCARAKKKDGQP